MLASPLSGTVCLTEEIMDGGVCSSGSKEQNVHLLSLIAYEYLTARVIQQNIYVPNLFIFFYLSFI